MHLFVSGLRTAPAEQLRGYLSCFRKRQCLVVGLVLMGPEGEAGGVVTSLKKSIFWPGFPFGLAVCSSLVLGEFLLQGTERFHPQISYCLSTCLHFFALCLCL